MVINGCGTSKLKILEILQQCPRLRSVQLPPVDRLSKMLVEAVALCPQIAHINLSQHDELDDDDVLMIAQRLKGLKSICISSMSDVSDDMLAHLAVHASATLEVVYVFAIAFRNDAAEPDLPDACGFSDTAVANLREKCTHFKAINYSVLQARDIVPSNHLLGQAAALMLSELSTGLPEKMALHCGRLQALTLTFLRRGGPLPEAELVRIVESCAALRVVYVPSERVSQLREFLVLYPRVQVQEETKKTFYYDVLQMSV